MSDSVERRFSRSIAREGPWREDERILVALSGGGDSVALLLLLRRWKQGSVSAPEILAGHLQHQLRGEESEADEQFCRDLCERLEIPLLVASCDVRARAEQPGLSIEEAGRDARLECFARWARQEQLSAIVTAHHRDDQVETILGNIVRGCGLAGLAGIPRRRPLPGAESCLLLKPLLDVPRSDLEEVLHRSGIDPRHDSSNDHLGHRRNRIRLRWLPLLREENPALDEAIVGLSGDARERLAEESHSVGKLLESAFCTCSHVSLLLPPAAAIASSSSSLQALFCGMWLSSSGGTGGLSRSHIEGAVQLLRRLGRSHRVELPGSRVLHRCGRWIHLGPSITSADSDGPIDLDWKVPLRFNGIEWSPGGEGDAVFILPEEASGPGLRLRGALKDDRWQEGESRSRLWERLREVGVPAHIRPLWPVVESSGKIVAIPGVTRKGSRRISLGFDPEGLEGEFQRELWHHLSRTLVTP